MTLKFVKIYIKMTLHYRSKPIPREPFHPIPSSIQPKAQSSGDVDQEMLGLLKLIDRDMMTMRAISRSSRFKYLVTCPSIHRKASEGFSG